MGQPAQDRQRQVYPDGALEHETLAAALRRNVTNTAGDGVTDIASLECLPTNAHLTTRSRACANDE